MNLSILMWTLDHNAPRKFILLNVQLYCIKLSPPKYYLINQWKTTWLQLLSVILANVSLGWLFNLGSSGQYIWCCLGLFTYLVIGCLSVGRRHPWLRGAGWLGFAPSPLAELEHVLLVMADGKNESVQSWTVCAIFFYLLFSKSTQLSPEAAPRYWKITW